MESSIKIERNANDDLLTIKLIIRYGFEIQYITLLEDLNSDDWEFVRRYFVGKTFKENKND